VDSLYRIECVNDRATEARKVPNSDGLHFTTFDHLDGLVPLRSVRVATAGIKLFEHLGDLEALTFRKTLYGPSLKIR